MIRTQIYLTEQEQTALRGLSSRTGRTQSQLIRDAIDRLIEQGDSGRQKETLAAAAGLWSERSDLPDFAQVRNEADRVVPEGL